MRNVCSIVIATLMLIGPAGCSTGDGGLLDSLGQVLQGGELSEGTVVAGLKEALRVGTARAVNSLSKEGGYSNDQALRIGMPNELQKLTKTMRQVGLSRQVDQFEQKMNEAAESAASQAAPVFLDAIVDMSFDDARKILGGEQTAITDYFRLKTHSRLTQVYTPVVRDHMEQVGAVKQYNAIVNRYHAIPLVPKIQFSPDTYVTERALDGLFASLAGVERDIRANPKARTTALLKRVFSR